MPRNLGGALSLRLKTGAGPQPKDQLRQAAFGLGPAGRSRSRRRPSTRQPSSKGGSGSEAGSHSTGRRRCPWLDPDRGHRCIPGRQSGSRPGMRLLLGVFG